MILAGLLILAAIVLAYEISVYQSHRRARMDWQGRRRLP